MTGNNSCRLSYIEFEMSIFHFYIPKLFQFLSLSSLLPLISIKQLTQPVISQELFSILLNYLSASVSWMQITLILMLTVLRRKKKKRMQIGLYSGHQMFHFYGFFSLYFTEFVVLASYRHGFSHYMQKNHHILKKVDTAIQFLTKRFNLFFNKQQKKE